MAGKRAGEVQLIERGDLLSVPIFPLPDYVLFPNTLVPFHIFEPRYLQMMEECLAGSRMVVVTGLMPGWEVDYYATPPVHRIGCVGKVVNEERLEDGRLNVFVHGLRRVSIGAMQQSEPYRLAEVRVLGDTPSRSLELERNEELRLRQIAHQLLRLLGRGGEPLAKALGNTDTLATLTFRFASMLVTDPEDRQRLLEARDPMERCELLVGHLGQFILELVGAEEGGEESVCH